jgi:predicted SprT family Zn-dependent metalloprotease
MDRKELEIYTNRYAYKVWADLCELRPKLVRYDPTKIVLNARLWRTAGCCFQATRRIDLGFKFFLHSKEYANIMRDVIIPHEVIHQADFDLYGESELKCGHGENWRKLMLEYGLPANKFHSMEINRK